MATTQAIRGPSTLLDLITSFDNAPLDFDSNHSPFYRLYLAPDPRPHGYIHPTTMTSMPWPPSFSIDHTTRSITLSEPPPTSSLSDHANAAFQAAVDAAIDGNVFPQLNGMHSEYFRVVGARGFVQLERFAATLFGIATRGAHLTAYVRDSDPESAKREDKGLKIWVARRSKHLYTYPHKLDSTVAGGVKASDSPLTCILTESQEEASLPSAITSRIIPVGVVTLAHINARGLFHGEILHVYDLEMKPGEVATPGDDEVEEFVLMSVGEVKDRMMRGEFKNNVCPVMIDFLVRHGIVTPESEGEGQYVDICSRLGRTLPMPMASDQAP